MNGHEWTKWENRVMEIGIQTTCAVTRVTHGESENYFTVQWGEEGSCFCKLKTIVAGDRLILLSWFKVGCQTMSMAIHMPRWLHPQHLL